MGSTISTGSPRRAFLTPPAAWPVVEGANGTATAPGPAPAQARPSPSPGPGPTASPRPSPSELIAARPDWESYFMQMARLTATRSSCHRRAVGAVIVRDRHVLATGYNGNPAGFKHCAETGCIREMLNVPSGAHHELCTGLHAEQNAILQAAKVGTSIDGSILYTTTFPCVTCAKMLLNVGVREIVYEEGYPDELGRWMLARSSVVVRRFGEGVPEDLRETSPDALESVVATMSMVPNPRA